MPVAHVQLWQPKTSPEIARYPLGKEIFLPPTLRISDLSLYPSPYSYPKNNVDWLILIYVRHYAKAHMLPILIFMMILSGIISTKVLLDMRKVWLREISNLQQNALQNVHVSLYHITWQFRKNRIPVTCFHLSTSHRVYCVVVV